MAGSYFSDPPTIESYISHLPWEILQQIFRNLDGRSSMCCRRVCKTWEDHIDYLEKKNGFWYDKCQKEIPGSVRLDILDNIFPGHWQKTKIEDFEWKMIYKCWYNWRVIHKKIAVSQTLEAGFNGISAMKVSGEWLLITTCDGGGKLTVRNIQKATSIDMFVTTNAILDFELVNCDEKTSVNMTGNMELEDIFNTMEHNEIWLELKDCYIQLGKNYWYSVDKIHQKIRHSYGYQVRLVHNGCYSPTVLYLRKICSDVSGPTKVIIELPLFYSHVLDFWQNRVSLSCYEESVSCIKVNSVTVNMNSQEVERFDKCLLPCTDKTYSRIYSWRGSLFVLTNKRTHNLIFRTAGKAAKQNISTTRTDITSVLFYCNYLFLGSDQGKLYIYRVDSSCDSLPTVVHESEAHTIKVDNSKIFHIAVIEPSNCGGHKPMIACASSNNVYLISFTDCCLKHG